MNKGVMISMSDDDLQRLEILMRKLGNMNRSDVIRLAVMQMLESILHENQH